MVPGVIIGLVAPGGVPQLWVHGRQDNTQAEFAFGRSSGLHISNILTWQFDAGKPLTTQERLMAGIETVSGITAVGNLYIHSINKNKIPIVSESAADYNLARTASRNQLIKDTGLIQDVTERSIARSRVINNIMEQDFPKLQLRAGQYPVYDPELPLSMYSEATKEGAIKIGPLAFESKNPLLEIREGIVHEELHHRLWFDRHIPYKLHHPEPNPYVGPFQRDVDRYMRFRGWK